MQAYSDHELLDRLKTENSSSFSLVYEMYFSSVASFVKQNKGNQEDAEDIFQEAMIVMLRRMRQPSFQLTSTLKTYLFAIVKHLWLKRLRDNKLTTTVDFEQALSAHQIEATLFVIETNPEKSTEEQVQNWLQRITENCQRILKAIFFYQQPINELMVIMGWKNRHTAANQKYKCMEQLRRESERNGEG